MPRKTAVPQPLVLPNPPERYDASDQRETRRLIMDSVRRLLDWGSLSNVPSNIDQFASLGSMPNGMAYFNGDGDLDTTTLSELGRALIAIADEAAGRTALGMGALAVRKPLVITTAALANNASESGIAAMSTKSAALITITADRKCRVRFYSSDTARDADASRADTVKGTAGTGLLAEFVFDAAGTIPVSPVAILANEEGTPQARLFYNITNTSGATSTVTATCSILPLEI